MDLPHLRLTLPHRTDDEIEAMPLRPEEQCWLPELDHHDPETRCVGVVMLSSPEASAEALLEVADLMRDIDPTVRDLVFARLLEHPAIPQQIEGPAYRFVRRDRYTDKRNYIRALRLLMRANSREWRWLVNTQIDHILSYEKDEAVKTMAQEVLKEMEEKK